MNRQPGHDPLWRQVIAACPRCGHRPFLDNLTLALLTLLLILVAIGR